MGFDAGTWIIGTIAYFFFFFLIITGIQTIYASVGALNTDVTAGASGVDFISNTDGVCVGSSPASEISLFPGFGQQVIACWKLPEISNNDSCNNIDGCYWSGVFDTCKGYVNHSRYGITDNSSRGICQGTLLLKNQALCETFGCEFMNTTQIYLNGDVLDGNVDFFNLLFYNIKWIVTLNFDIGLGIYNFIFSTIFFWFPFIMLIYAIVRSFPFTT